MDDLVPVSVGSTNIIELPPALADVEAHGATVRVLLVKSDEEGENPLRTLLSETQTGLSGDLLDPPYDMAKLAGLFDISSGLRPNIDAYATNIESCGFRFNPAIDLNAPDAVERVRAAMFLERLVAAEEGEVLKRLGKAECPTLNEELAAYDDVEEPKDAEVEERLRKLRRLGTLELARARAFFTFVNPDGSFVALRNQCRTELEQLGNAYWEIVRDKLGRISRILYVPAVTVRLAKLDEQATEVTERVRVADLHWREVTQKRHFRRFAQVQTLEQLGAGSRESVIGWFKEFGDPRVVSKQSGKYYADEDALRKAEPDSSSATEILHFKIFSPGSPYGVPRWVGNMPGVLGSRELDQINEAYFDNKAVPPLALLVSGGRLAANSLSRFESFFKSDAKGIKNFHRVIVIEAEPAAATSDPTKPSMVPKLSFERLRDAQQDDALFQNYDARNLAKLGMSFRVPEALRGVSGPGSLAAMRQTEAQVFRPLRNEFDETMNRRIMPELGIRFWSFQSNAPDMFDAEALAKAITEHVKEGILMPMEGRALASVVYNRDLPPIKEEWAKRPLALTLAMTRILSGPAEAARATTGADQSPESVLEAITIPTEDAAVLSPSQPKAPAKPNGAGKKPKARQLSTDEELPDA